MGLGFIFTYLPFILMYFQMFHVDMSEAYKEIKNTGDLIKNLITCIHYAAMNHKDQRRKDSKKTPYINHPIGVAFSVVREAHVTDVDIVRAALLHDIVEDTNGTLDEIALFFGDKVADLVAEVTDDKSLPKAERKEQQIIKAPTGSYGAKIIKLADKLYNLRDLEQECPEGWTEERREEYFCWAFKVVNGLRGTNKDLEDKLDEIFRRKKLME